MKNQLRENSVKVLLVDDDEEDYILTKFLFDDFKDNAYHLQWTSDYDFALEAMLSNAHDVYLVDYRLGSKNGLELLSQAIAAGCRAPAILLTGQGDKEVDLEAMKAGAADYLVKGEIEAPLLERSIRYSIQQARTLEKLLHEATHDALTGLPNRANFSHFLKDKIDTAHRRGLFNFAVLFLDLDRFKIINDGLGHVVGDKLLVAISERLKNCLRAGDIVSRFGGDEFTILAHRVNAPEDAIEIAERLQNGLSAPFKLDGYEVFTSASIGITLAESGRHTPEEFLRDADTAMYRAKASGKARFEIFDPEMHIRNMNLLQMENDLRRAIDRREFAVFYQPILDLENGKVCELEALLRWEHPEHGLIAPNEFIPVAEETGLIVPIGRWVLEESCRQIGKWQKQFGLENRLSVSVNLSAKQLIHANLTAQISEIMRTTGICPRSLKLEVTETSVMENADVALEILSGLCALGVRISSDDFGTGYSSLNYLHRFPFERLKIDRSFVGRMDKDAKSEEIVRTILLLAANLNLEVVAEGIETKQQFQQLRELGCRLAQGFLFSKPVTAVEIASILKDGLPLEFDSFTPYAPLDSILEVSEIQ